MPLKGNSVARGRVVKDRQAKAGYHFAIFELLDTEEPPYRGENPGGSFRAGV